MSLQILRLDEDIEKVIIVPWHNHTFQQPMIQKTNTKIHFDDDDISFCCPLREGRRTFQTTAKRLGSSAASQQRPQMCGPDSALLEIPLGSPHNDTFTLSWKELLRLRFHFRSDRRHWSDSTTLLPSTMGAHCHAPAEAVRTSNWYHSDQRSPAVPLCRITLAHARMTDRRHLGAARPLGSSSSFNKRRSTLTWLRWSSGDAATWTSAASTTRDVWTS